MGEFLEYIKQLHDKLSSGKKKFDKLKDLANDSISEISDLSNEGILSTSMNKLSIFERKRLSNYVGQLRQVQSSIPTKHDCLAKPKPGKAKIDNSKQVVEM